MSNIISIKKDKRKDISIFTATLENGNAVSIEASNEIEAKEKIEAHLENMQVAV
jgi:hypothetical protein